MKLFNISLFKKKLLPFPEFRDSVRLAVRRNVPGAKLESRDDGFVMTLNGVPTLCNLRSLYIDYKKSSEDYDALVQRYIDSLVTEPPEHTWMEAQMTLRPTLKNGVYLQNAQYNMQKASHSDAIPFAPFVGDVSVIVMRDLPGTAVAVTKNLLDFWGITFDAALKQSMSNMNMMSLPLVTNVLTAGAGGKSVKQEVGLVFEGDHLTATWLLLERFRDYVGQRLEGDYVAAIPVRNRLVAIRADESGLIAQIQQSNRNFSGQMYALTSQSLHVSAAKTGGLVTIYEPGNTSGAEILDPNSVFASGAEANMAPAPRRGSGSLGPVDLGAWGGLSESTDNPLPPLSGKSDRGRR